MSAYEIGIIVVGALTGWWVVSWVIDKVREVNSRPPAYRVPGDRQPDDAKKGDEGDS